MGKTRALGVVRISVGGFDQTGPETQRTRITKRIEAEDAELVGFAEDIDVSASIFSLDASAVGRLAQQQGG